MRLELSEERRAELAPDLAALRAWLEELEQMELEGSDPILAPIASDDE